MPGWNEFKKKFALEVGDLPNPQGANVVMIEKFDTERFSAVNPETKQTETQTRHRMWLVGFEYPLRLNNTRVETLAAVLGCGPEESQGRKIVLLAGTVQRYGKTVPDIVIHPYAPDEITPCTDVPYHLAARHNERLMLAMQYGVRVAQARTALPGQGTQPQPGSVSQSTPAAQPPRKFAATGIALGKEAAAELMMLLKERASDWNWLTLQLSTRGMGELVANRQPFECDGAIREPAWRILKDMPVTVGGFDREKAKAALITAWTPPAPVQGEVIDRTTGEVVNPNDIPF